MPPFTFPMVACAGPVPLLFAVAMPKLLATTVTFHGALAWPLYVTRTA